jgi:hypothetical protein
VAGRADDPDRSKGRRVVLLCPGYLSQRLRGSMSRRRRDSRSSLRAPIAVPATRTMSSAATAATSNQLPPLRVVLRLQRTGLRGDPIHAPRQARPARPTLTRGARAFDLLRRRQSVRAPRRQRTANRGHQVQTPPLLLGRLVRRFAEGHDVIISRVAAPQPRFSVALVAAVSSCPDQIAAATNH